MADNIPDHMRDFIKRLMEEYPRSSRNRLCDLFIQEIVKPENVDYHKLALKHTFSMFYKSALRAHNPQTEEQRSANYRARREHEALENEYMAERTNLVLSNLLDVVIPMYGKPYRACTGAECRKLTGFFGGVGERLRPDEVVGDVFSNNDLRQMWIDSSSSSGEPAILHPRIQ